MVKQIFLLLALLPTLLFGQSKKLELGFLIGNNGQLNNTLNDFYVVNYFARIPPNSIDIKTTNSKYSASARYFFTDNFSVRIKFGKAIRKEINTKASPTFNLDYDIYQSVTNISPSVCFSKRIDKLEIMTGLEIPFIHVGNFTVKSKYKYMPDSVNATIDDYQKEVTTGGFIWGVNNFIGVKYHFTNWLSLGTEISYGFLFANLGGKYTVEYAKDPATPLAKTYEINRKYKRTFFSTPEVSFGLFIQLGGKKTKT